MNTIIQLIEEKLKTALKPTQIFVRDDRDEHKGHAHQDSGHFTVQITSELFTGKNLIARHRFIYQALGSLMQTHIHALRIEAKAPNE